MFCRKCGKQIQDGYEICAECYEKETVQQFQQAKDEAEKRKKRCVIAAVVAGVITLILAISMIAVISSVAGKVSDSEETEKNIIELLEDLRDEAQEKEETEKEESDDEDKDNDNADEDEDSDDENLISIPAELRYTRESYSVEEYQPKIVFEDDNTCTITYNMLEYMQDIGGEYEVYDTNEGKVIKIYWDTDDLYDPDYYTVKQVLLVEKNDEEWVYYGESMGATGWGPTTYNVYSDKKIEAEKEDYEEYDIKMGTYTGDGNSDEFIVTDTDDDELVADIFWYRYWSDEDVPFKRYGNFAVITDYYDYTLEEYENLSGYIELTDEDELELVITRGLPDSSCYIGSFSR